MYAVIVAQQGDWGNWIQHAIGRDLIAVIAVAGGLLMCIIAILAKNWKNVRIAEIEGALKQQMLDKGMSAADIQQVLGASRRSSAESFSPPDDTPADVPALVKMLAEYEYSGEDIERILRALPSDAASDGRFRERVATIKSMMDNEMSAEDIERVLKTCANHGKPSAASPTV